MNALNRDLNTMVKLAEQQTNTKEDPWRLKLHLMPPVGWLNDPNGLCWMNGLYHVFFQYSPFNPEGGLKLWGHYTSPDLIHWTYKGAPMLADQPFDCHGAYSGSALVCGDQLHLFYTGNVKLPGNYDYINTGRESYTLHGIYDEKTERVVDKVCMLGPEDYPEDFTCHIRDPKVWSDASGYHMILGGRSIQDAGKVLLYDSKDLKQWRYVGAMTSKEPFGYMWECPDLFTVEDTHILSVSPQGVPREGLRHQNVYLSGYFTVSGENLQNYTLSEFKEWDRGFDFYAPQTFEDGQGRRLLIGWMGLPDIQEEYSNPTVDSGWQHALTLPREISVKDGQVLQNPVSELLFLRGQCYDLKDAEALQALAAKPAQAYELDIKAQCQKGCPDNDLTVTIGRDLQLMYQGETGIFEMCFTGPEGQGRTSRKAELSQCDKLRIIVDTSSVEVFINDGVMVFTTRYYPSAPSIQAAVKGNHWEGNLFTLKDPKEA